MEGEENLSEMEDREKQTLNAIKAKPNWRLACQVSVLGDIKIDYVPITDPRRKSE
jgi:ferredoxin